MDIRYLDKNFAIAPQVSPDALPGLRDAGLATIICNRQDYTAGYRGICRDRRRRAQGGNGILPDWAARPDFVVRCKACAGLTGKPSFTLGFFSSEAFIADFSSKDLANRPF